MFRLILVLMLLGRAAPPAVRAGECVVVARLDGDLLAVGGNECERRTLPGIDVQDSSRSDRSADRRRRRKHGHGVGWCEEGFSRLGARSHARLRHQVVRGLVLSARRCGNRTRAGAPAAEGFRLWLAKLLARSRSFLVERRFDDLPTRAGRIPSEDVHLQAAGRTPPHRCGQGRDDHAGGHAVERLGRSPLSAAVAARHDRAPEDRKWNSRRRARELACR